MDLNKCISRSFDNRRTSHDRSTVFDATFEQAQLSDRKSCPKQSPLDLNRNPISQRSSNTYHSELFRPAARQLQRFRLNQPQDHSYRDFYGESKSEFYRKAQVSDFQPNFQPKFSYQPGWEVNHPGFENKEKGKEVASEVIKPVRKRLCRSDSSRQALETKLEKFTLDDTGGRIKDLATERNERRERNERSHDLSYTERNKFEGSQDFEKLNKTGIIGENCRKEMKKVKFEKSSSPNNLSQTLKTSLKPDEEPRVRPIYKENSKRLLNSNRSSTPTAFSSRGHLSNRNPLPSSAAVTSSTPQKSVRSPSPSTNICLSISGLTSKESEYSLRESFKGFQIVSLSSSRNNISGVNSGTASITLKATESSLAELKSSFEQKGLNVELSHVSVGKKNNYAELAHVDFLNQFVNRNSSRTPVKHHLESSQDLFGSSPGVGRFHSGKKIRDKQAVVLQTWNFVKNQRKEEKNDGLLNSLPSYMRSTQSSARKCKKVN